MNKITNIGGLIIGIIGIIFGFYFHYSSKDEKNISYYLDLDSYKIYDNSNTNGLQKLSLYKDDSVKINQDVYLTTFSIWNSGNMPININDIRKELSINFKGVENILESKIIKENTPDISEFKLIQKTPSSFNIKWRYFDPKDGVRFQILYTGEENISVNIEGKILKTDFQEFTLLKDKTDTKFMLFIGPIFLIMLLYASINLFKDKLVYPFNRFAIFSLLNDNSKKYLKKGIKIFVFIMFVMYLILIPLFYYKYFFGINNIPF